MSFAATTWVFDHADIPNSQAFATLIVFASFANEHGRAYPATNTVAAKSRQNPKTVRAAIDVLEAVGLLVDTGRRVGETGNVKVYALGMEGIPEVGSLKGEKAPAASEQPQEPATAPNEEAHPETGGLADEVKAPVSGPEGTRKRVGEPARNSLPLEGANAPSAPKGGKSRGRNPNWEVPPIASLPPAVRAIAEQWPSGAYEAEATGHAAWLAGQRRRVAKPDAGWHARIVQLGAKPIQAAKAGLRYEREAARPLPTTAPAAIARCGTAGEGQEAATLRATLRGSMGPVLFEKWLEPCRFDFAGDELTVVAPTPFVVGWLKEHYASRLAHEASQILGCGAHLRWEVGKAA